MPVSRVVDVYYIPQRFAQRPDQVNVRFADGRRTVRQYEGVSNRNVSILARLLNERIFRRQGAVEPYADGWQYRDNEEN